MNWFLIALGAPFLWALVNISDQYLVEKYSTGERGSGGLVLFSSLIGVFVALGIFIFVPNVFGIPFLDKFLLILTGGLTIAWVILYLFSLEIEDVSSVVPYFLSIPIFGFFFGYLFLGETLTNLQLIGSVVVLLGLVILSIDFTGEQKKKFKMKVALYMLIACALVAGSGVIFKFVTVEGNYWVSSFWEYAGLGVFGILIYFFVPKYRREFDFMNKKGGLKIFMLNILSEITTIGGNLLTNFALLLAPVTMIYLVSSFQPAIVLGLSIVGTIFFPRIIKEDISKKVLFPKIFGIAIAILGSVVLFWKL